MSENAIDSENISYYDIGVVRAARYDGQQLTRPGARPMENIIDHNSLLAGTPEDLKQKGAIE